MFLPSGILAALASSSSTISVALQLAFCHLFFNITGIILFYPVPRMRLIVLNTAKYLGRTTARYRWFAIAYIIAMFIIFPGFLFAVSTAGRIVFILTISTITLVIAFVIVINIMQSHTYLQKFLPVCLQTWNFLPEVMRSLAPIDRLLSRVTVPCRKSCCQCCMKHCHCENELPDTDMGYIDSDSDIESSMQSSYLHSAASSRIFSSSQSGINLKSSSSSRIYKPREAVSRKDSLKKSPSVVKQSIPEAAEPSPAMALLEDNDDHNIKFYISKSDLHKAIHRADGEIVTVTVPVLQHTSKESVI